VLKAFFRAKATSLVFDLLDLTVEALGSGVRNAKLVDRLIKFAGKQSKTIKD